MYATMYASKVKRTAKMPTAITKQSKKRLENICVPRQAFDASVVVLDDVAVVVGIRLRFQALALGFF
jgi:hypothetical protein